MKRLRIITFWIGVNILGLPKFLEHKFNRKGEVKEVVYSL